MKKTPRPPRRIRPSPPTTSGRESTNAPKKQWRGRRRPARDEDEPPWHSRLAVEKPEFKVVEVTDPKSGEVHYETRGNLNTPVPPIRDSKYLDKKQATRDLSLDAAKPPHGSRRWKIFTSRAKSSAEFISDLARKPAPVASAYALDKDDWIGPMIRNQGALLVRGFYARDMMMQYMAKAGSPTKGRDGSSHFGDIRTRNMVSPISMLGDLIPVLAGVALGARLQGSKSPPDLIGDGGQSTGVTYEGIELRRGAKTRAGAVGRKQSVGIFDSQRYAILRERSCRPRHWLWHSWRDRRWHRRLPGIRRDSRSRASARTAAKAPRSLKPR